MRTHDELIAALQERTPIDAREQRSIERFIDELGRLPGDPYDERRPVHVTTSAIIVGRRGVVLHRHRVLGTWVAPGGHVDAGEDPGTAVLREATEETGLDVAHPAAVPQLVHVDVHIGPHGHTHLDLRYLLDGGDADPAPPPGESPDVGWYTWAEALDRAEASMQPVLRHVATIVA